MSERPKALFEELDPPRGGLVRLRARLADDRRQRRRRRRWVAAGALAVALAAAMTTRPPAPVPGSAEEATGWTDLGLGAHPTMTTLGLVAAPTEAVTVIGGDRQHTAVEAVPTSDDSVVFYRVASLDEPAPQRD